MSTTETTKPQVRVMTGNEACAEAALAAGCRFYAGYPITPSTEIAEILARHLPRFGGRFVQMEDEIAAMGAIIGASLAGAKSMTATSGPGFSLKQENIGYACMTEIPCVVVDVQRGGPSTGLPTMPAQADVMQARWGTHGDHPIIALCPRSVRETYDLTIRAFNIAELYRTPVILLLDEIVSHVNEKVELPSTVQVVERVDPDDPPESYLPYRHTPDDVPPMVSFGRGYRFHVTGLAHDETGFPTNNPAKIEALIERLHRKIERHHDQIVHCDVDMVEGATIGVFAYGSTARSARRAVKMAREEKGIPVSFVSPTTIWPFPVDQVRALGQQVKTIVVPEMNRGQLGHEVEWAVRGAADVLGLWRFNGEPISPQDVLAKIEEAASR